MNDLTRRQRAAAQVLYLGSRLLAKPRWQDEPRRMPYWLGALVTISGFLGGGLLYALLLRACA